MEEEDPTLVIDGSKLLLVVDVQYDFVPGGALPVPDGDKVIPTINKYVTLFTRNGGKVAATMDWHPVDHCSFKAQGGPWPPHCVQGTRGAELHLDLRLPRGTYIVRKGKLSDEEAYSGFQGTLLAKDLRSMGVRTLFVGGLATDYCVKNTVLDGLDLGFEVYLLEDAVQGIEAQPGDVERAKTAMFDAGAKPLTYGRLEAANER
jgi:nicotinamidase/pyrazinamidase